jgi:hypothetical protein
MYKDSQDLNAKIHLQYESWFLVLKLSLLSHFFIFSILPPSANGSTEQVFIQDIRLMGAELVDDMFYQWLKDPPLASNVSLTLTDISAPIGLDSRFNDLIENRIYELIQKNPQLKITLSHCAACQQLIAVSNSTQTILSRGIDQPEVLAGILKINPNSLALSLNFEARSRELILIAQIFEVAPPQKIHWAHRYSTNMGLRQTLREAAPLISLEDARKVQNQILMGREPMKLVSRLHIRNFQSSSELGALQPLLFIEQSLESEILPWRDQRVGLSVGLTSIRDAYSGWTLGGRYSNLMMRETPSLIYPDLYWFFGLQYLRLQGLGAAVFAEDQIDVAKLLKENEDPKVSLTSYQIGLEALIKYRFGLSVYIEYFPGLENSRVVAMKSFVLPYQGVGTALVFQW